MALARAKAVNTDPDGPLLDALTAWFASKDAISAAGLPPGLLEGLVEAGMDRGAAVQAGEMATKRGLTGRTSHGSPAAFNGMPATRRVAAEEPGMRAAYVLAAARRLTAAADYERALANEQRYLAAHVAAGRKRRVAAREVDKIGHDNQVLVWRTAGDDRVDPRCRALEGRLFTAANPPGGQLPGAVHGRCRCHAAQWGGRATWPITQ